MTRRELLKRLAWFACATPLGVRSGAEPQPSAPSTWLLDPEEALRLGRRYLEEHPDERSAVASLSSWVETERARARHAEVVRSDFARGRLVVIEGLVLARAEARLLASLGLG